MRIASEHDAGRAPSRHDDPTDRVLYQLRHKLPTVGVGPLRFRALASDDYQRLWEATRHPEFNACLPWPAPDNPEGALERIHEVLADQQAGNSLAFACEPVGAARQWAAVFRFTRWRDGLETGLWLHPDYWGKGYGTKIIAAVIEAAFEVSSVPAIYSKTTEDNVGACRITTRCGMTVVGRASAPNERGGTLQGIEWKITRAEAAERAVGVILETAAV